jgi:MFS family permease
VNETGFLPSGYRELVLRNPRFRNLWCGQIAGLLGDWFNLIASAALVAMLTESGLAVGALFVIRMLAPFLVSPVAGVVADQFSRKSILIVTDLLRAVTVLGFLLVRDPEDVWLLYSLTALQLGISGFFYPARTALLPDIVSRRELGTANALTSATWSVMLAVGAALGGIVSGAFGIHVAFVVDSLTFVISALFIVRIRLEVTPVAASAVNTLSDGIRQYLDGLRYLIGRKDVLVITLHKAALGLLLGATCDIVQVAITETVFVIGIGGGLGLGLIFGATGIGTGLGPILIRRFTGDRESALRFAIVFGYLLGGLGLAICAPLLSFGAVLAGALVRGLGGGIIWVFSTQLLLHMVPGEVRGRIFATELALFTLVSAVGSAVAGVLLDTSLGISGVAWALAGLAIVPATLWMRWISRQN